jgi:hypothetical protein
VTSPRAIRIPRAKPAGARTPSDAGTPGVAVPLAEAAPTRREKLDRRPNQAATERAHRLAAIYLGALVVLYASFLVLDRSAPGGTSATAQTGLIYFTAFAAVLAVGGLWVALAPAPSAIEVRPDAVLVIEVWGRKRQFPPMGEIRASLVRRYPSGFLSSRAVETLEITDTTGHRRTYQFEEGLIPMQAIAPRAIF